MRLLAQLAVIVLVLAGLVLVIATRRSAPSERSVLTPILAVGTAVLGLSGLAPYLGLKTETSFEMFSDLRTEPGAWNGLVVPEAVRVFGYQDDATVVLPAGSPVLRFELERYLRAHPGAVATVGDASGIHPVGPLPPGTTLVERIALFRPLAPPGVPRC